MRSIHAIFAAALLVFGIVVAALLGLGSCSSSDPKSLTDDGYAALGKGENKSAAESFERALAQIGTNANDPSFLRASLGRCVALAKIDPVRARTEFIALAKAQPGKVREDDFTLVGSALLVAGSPKALLEAIDLLKTGEEFYPGSAKVKDFKERVIADSKRSQDPEAVRKLKSFGYL
jgi:hypothetical protein